MREPRSQLLLASPFITIILSFLLINGLFPKADDDENLKKILTFITTQLFSFFVLLGFSICSGLFILAPVSDKEQKLR